MEASTREVNIIRGISVAGTWFPILAILPFFVFFPYDKTLTEAFGNGALFAPTALLALWLGFIYASSLRFACLMFLVAIVSLIAQGVTLSRSLAGRPDAMLMVGISVAFYIGLCVFRTANVRREDIGFSEND